MLLRRLGWLVLLALQVVIVRAVSAVSPSVTLAWNPSPVESVAGYRLYIGVVSQDYPTSLDVATNTSATISHLTPGQTYYFAVTAYDNQGLESAFSGEISYTVPNPNLIRLNLTVIGGMKVLLAGHGPPGYQYAVMSSPDLLTWDILGGVATDASGNCQFTEPLVRAAPVRYYRLLQTSP